MRLLKAQPYGNSLRQMLYHAVMKSLEAMIIEFHTFHNAQTLRITIFSFTCYERSQIVMKNFYMMKYMVLVSSIVKKLLPDKRLHLVKVLACMLKFEFKISKLKRIYSQISKRQFSCISSKSLIKRTFDKQVLIKIFYDIELLSQHEKIMKAKKSYIHLRQLIDNF